LLFTLLSEKVFLLTKISFSLVVTETQMTSHGMLKEETRPSFLAKLVLDVGTVQHCQPGPDHVVLCIILLRWMVFIKLAKTWQRITFLNTVG